MKRSVNCFHSSTLRTKDSRPEIWIATPGPFDISIRVDLKWSVRSHLPKTLDSTVNHSIAMIEIQMTCV